jgi:hypothetical protein
MQLQRVGHRQRSPAGGTQTLAADYDRCKCQGNLVDDTGGEQIIVQSRSALAEQPRQPSAGQLINDQGQIE